MTCYLFIDGPYCGRDDVDVPDSTYSVNVAVALTPTIMQASSPTGVSMKTVTYYRYRMEDGVTVWCSGTEPGTDRPSLYDQLPYFDVKNVVL